MSSASTSPFAIASPTVADRSTPPFTQLDLLDTDRSRLQNVVHSGHESARAQTRAQVLLKLSEGWSLVEVCRAFDVCRNTVVAVQRRFEEGGVDAVVRHKRQAQYRQALSGAPCVAPHFRMEPAGQWPDYRKRRCSLTRFVLNVSPLDLPWRAGGLAGVCVGVKDDRFLVAAG